MSFLFKSRPDSNLWKPVANFSDSDERDAYKRAARKLGLDIRIGYPVPANVGADFCNRLGMKGIYIRRTQSEKEYDLITEHFVQLRALSQ